MKKFIYIFGIVLLNIFTFGAIFKVMHWPGAGILLAFGLGLFALVFLPMAFVNNYRGVGKKHLSLYIAGFICALICVIGALFKVQHWPGASLLMIVGVPLPFLYFLPVYLYHQNKEKEKSIINFLGIMFLLLYISVFSALLSLNVSRDIIVSMAVSAESNAKTTQLYILKTKLMYQQIDSAGSIENKEKANIIKEKTNELSSKIESIKRELIIAVEGSESLSIKDSIIDLRSIVKKDETNHTELIMRGDNGVSGQAAVLKGLIKKYQQFLITMLNEKTESINMINELLNTSNVTTVDQQSGLSVPWEDSYFQHGNYLIIILDKLECIETKVKMAEAEVLEAIASK